MVWAPPKPIKFTAPKVDKKTTKTLKSLGHGRMEHLADTVRERNTSARVLSAKADYLNASRLADKHDFQQGLSQQVAAVEPQVAAQQPPDNPLSKTADSLQQLGAGKPYGGT